MLIAFPAGQGGHYTAPDSVIDVGQSAFQNCINLTAVTLHASVTNLADYAFSGCSTLTSFYFYGNTPGLGSSVFEGNAAGAKIYYLAGTTGWGPMFGGLPTVRLKATWYVATSGNDAADGLTWATAKQTIQAALDLTLDGDTVIVSNGVYATGGRTVNGYALSNRVVITKAVTVQSVNGPQVTIIQGAGPIGNSAVRCAYVGTNAILSGFTLTNGAARTTGVYFPDLSAGGVYCEGTAVVTNCTLTGNSGDSAGGVFGGTLNRCTLSNNWAVNWGGGARASTLNDCTLSGNSAGKQGGGAFQGTLNLCTLSGNLAGNEGGGAINAELNHCTLLGNHAGDSGGGSYQSTLNNCTLADNVAVYDGGGANGATLNNCIVYFNTAPTGSSSNYDSSTFNHSCTAPLPGTGTSNITSQPLFVATNDFHLLAASPCVDRGSNTYTNSLTDLDGNPRIVNGAVDMGAYEYQGPETTGYDAWAAAITNGLTSYSDNATGDGYPNLLKYATGSSPTNSDDLARLSIGTINGLARVIFNRNTNALDVTLYVEASDALTNSAPWFGIATNQFGSWSAATKSPKPATTRPLRPA